MSKPEIYQTLVLSTAHLTEEWAEEFDRCTESDILRTHNLIIQKTEYGIRVYTDLCLKKSAKFFNCAMRLAAKNKCRWLEYDCDADEVTGLKTYDW